MLSFRLPWKERYPFKHLHFSPRKIVLSLILLCTPYKKFMSIYIKWVKSSTISFLFIFKIHNKKIRYNSSFHNSQFKSFFYSRNVSFSFTLVHVYNSFLRAPLNLTCACTFLHRNYIQNFSAKNELSYVFLNERSLFETFHKDCKQTSWFVKQQLGLLDAAFDFVLMIYMVAIRSDHQDWILQKQG